MRRGLLGAAIAGATVGLIALASAAQQAATPDARGLELYEKRIRPLLAEKCYACHSARAAKVQGGLRLDGANGWLKGGASGPAVIPGDPDASPLLKAARWQGATQMPPAGKLPDRDIADLAAWVKAGAPAPKEVETGPKKPVAMTIAEGRNWWSFRPLRVQGSGFRVQVGSPNARTPESLDAIDAFLRGKLAARGLTPNPPADRRTLIRRASLDLIGLPPTPKEVADFLADKSPNAWEKVIDRLLASPHYGERWGRHWLDLARFAESHGYEQDYDRPNAYHYRDFVIRALNEDLPYDTFVRWQLAGDEYAPDNPMALMATGFLAAGTHATQITKNQVEKERYDELDDMLSTTCTAFLGLTAGCARCHDHKFDPIPTRDYYRMLSTFTTTVRSDYDVNMDPAGWKRAKEAFDAAHAPLVAAREQLEHDALPGRLDAWLATDVFRNRLPAWIVLDRVEAKSAGGADLKQQDDGSVLATGKVPDNDTYTITAVTRQQGITALRLEALADPSLVKGGPGRAPNGNFALSDFRVTAAPLGGSAKPVELALTNPRVDFEQKTQYLRDSIGKDHRLGWAIDPAFGKDHAAVWDIAAPAGFEGGTKLTFTLKFDHPNAGHSIGRFRLSVATAGGLAPLGERRPDSVEQILASLPHRGAPLSPEEHATLLAWYRTQDPEWRKLRGAELAHLASAPKPPVEKVLISSEGVPAVRTHTQGGDFLEHTNFLRRGDPNQKGEVATQAFLQVLERTSDGERHWQTTPPKGWRTSYQRRALADWITDVKSGAGPLLARVIVNRVWQHHFGRGIVATPSDFGTQGDRPTHPELFEWLAAGLVKNGWSLKRLHKLIMTSAAYQESAAGNAAAERADPANTLVWRHGRQRLEAEAIRDSMLAVSGELDDKMFGPGTLDESMKRRSIYFFVKRSKLIPSLMLFDAPNALLGLASRPATTVAPQALHLMNSPQVRAYAAAFAKRVAGSSPAESVRQAYELALSRPPTKAELADALAFLARQSATYPASSATPNPALVDLCQAILCLNEFVYAE